MPGGRRLLVALALVAAALVAWWLRPHARSQANAPAKRAAASASDAHHADVVGAAGTTASAPAPKLTLGGPTEDRLRANLEAYKRVAVYPPWSRRFTNGTKVLLDWNKPVAADLPMDDRAGKETSYRFDADRAHVAYGEAITSWIEVWRNDDPAKKLPITVEDAWVLATNGPKSGRMVRLSYHDDGQDGDAVAGDGRYTNRFVPSAVPELKQALQVHLAATISYDGVRRALMREFTYAPRKVVDVVGVSDAIRSGSLAVTLDVDVAEPGTYDFEANIMSGDGSVAIGYSQMNYRLGTGRQKVDLVFFGRMFGEVGVDGPYLVRDIRGIQLHIDDPEQNIPFVYGSTYTTRPWKRTDFSSAAWDDPEKQQRIAALQRAIDDTAAGRIGGPTTQPSHIEIDGNGVAHVINDPPPPPPPK